MFFRPFNSMDDAQSTGFQFSIRTALVLLSMFCVWLAHERHVVLERLAAVTVLEHDLRVFIDPQTTDLRSPEPRDVSWFRRIMGDGPVRAIWFHENYEQRDVDRFRRLFPEAQFGSFHEAKTLNSTSL